jgi:hypothetical protein
VSGKKAKLRKRLGKPAAERAEAFLAKVASR